jgi:hypothetical protein
MNNLKKLKVIEEANQRLEQSYLKSKGLLNEDIGSPVKDLYGELGYMKKNKYKTTQTSDSFSVGDTVKNSNEKNGQVIELLLGPNGEKIVYVKYDLEDGKPVTVRYNGDEIKDLSK